MSDTSERDEREVCWCQDERIWGHTAGSGEIGTAPGRALGGSPAHAPAGPSPWPAFPASPAAGRLEGQSFRAPPPAPRLTAAACAGTFPILPAAQPARRVPELRGIQTSRRPGDRLQVRPRRNRWELLDRDGRVVGQLAGSFSVPDGMRCRFATVLAIVMWSREKSEPEYQDNLRCDEWEVVVPELVFEPEA